MTRLVGAGFGFAEVCNMTIRQSHLLLAAVNRSESRRLRDAAFAARIAQADEKGWLKFMREVDDAG